MKTLILCGGKGLRIKGNFNEIPKPLIKIQNKCLLDYIINSYKSCGFNHFILLVGDNEKAFYDFAIKNNDTETVIEVLQTGKNTNTGGRIKQAESLIKEEECFFLTYGDGISNINFKDLMIFHKEHEKIVTLTAVKPQLPFGLLNLSKDYIVDSFIEKPILNEYINGGFFVLNKNIFNLLEDDSDFENKTLPQLSNQKQLNAYIHSGNWKSMDTFKDYLFLEENIHKLS